MPRPKKARKAARRRQQRLRGELSDSDDSADPAYLPAAPRPSKRPSLAPPVPFGSSVRSSSDEDGLTTHSLNLRRQRSRGPSLSSVESELGHQASLAWDALEIPWSDVEDSEIQADEVPARRLCKIFLGKVSSACRDRCTEVILTSMRCSDGATDALAVPQERTRRAAPQRTQIATQPCRYRVQRQLRAHHESSPNQQAARDGQ